MFPATPPAHIPPGRDARVIWCLTPTRGCVRTVRDPASGQAWDLDLTHRHADVHLIRQLGQQRGELGRRYPPFPATPSPDRNYVYPFTDQWHAARCNPEVFTSPQRNDADAAVTQPVRHAQPDARLVVPPGLHRGDVEHAGGQPRAATGWAATPSRAARRPARSSGSRNNANQGTRPRRAAADHEHVPVAAGRRLGLPAVRRRRLRHDGDRARVHPRDHQPDDRRSGRRHRRRPGRLDGRVVGRPGRRRVPVREQPARRRATRPFVTGGVRHRQHRSPASATTTSARARSTTPTSASTWSGREVHADGEIWGATNLRVREAFVKRYGDGHAAAAAALRRRPVAGRPRARATGAGSSSCSTRSCCRRPARSAWSTCATTCSPRTWSGSAAPTRTCIWNAFAESGLGEGAAATAPSDTDPTPSFASPFADNATVKLRPVDGRRGRGASGSTWATTRRGRSRSPTPTRPRRCGHVPDRARARTTSSSPGAGFGHAPVHRGSSGRPVQRSAREPARATSPRGRRRHGDRRRRQPRPSSTTPRRPTGRRWTAVAGKQVTVDLAGDRAAEGPAGQRQRAAAPGDRRRRRHRRPEPVQRAALVRDPGLQRDRAPTAPATPTSSAVYTSAGGRVPGRRVPRRWRRT